MPLARFVVPAEDLNTGYNARLRALADDVILIGVLYVPPDKPLSAGALQARQVRRKPAVYPALKGSRAKARRHIQREATQHH